MLRDAFDRPARTRRRARPLRIIEALESRRMLDGAFHSLASGSLLQDWSNTGLISANNDWSGVPSIIGYMGTGLVASAGVDPRTLTGATLGDVGVLANLTDPNTGSQAGPAEFQITDPVVAIRGSRSSVPAAPAPSLVFSLDTTGVTGTGFAMLLRDIDGSANNTIEPIAAQYRIGTTGAWTNLSDVSFVADASRGPSITRVSSFSGVLPVATDNQPQVQLRILTADAPGADEWIGLDDIEISATPATAAGTFVFADFATTATESSGAATMRIFRQGGTAGEASVTVTTRTGSATEGVDYTPVNTVVNFADGQAFADVVIPIANDSVLEGDENFAATLSLPTGGATVGQFRDIVISILDSEADATSSARLNEILGNPDGGTDNPFEFVEIRGVPNAPTTNLYYVALNGDAGASLGSASLVQSLNDFKLGSAGLLVIKSATGGSTISVEATVVPNRALEEQPSLSNNSVTHLLIRSAAPIYAGTDFDTNDDGTIDLPAGAVVVDSVGWSDGGAGDKVYSDAVLTQSSGTPDAASRFPHNLSANTKAAWYNGDIAASAPANPAGLVYDAAKNSGNLPPSAALTPGAANVGTTANTAPTSTADSYSTPAGAALNVAGSLGVLANDSDPDGDPIAAVLEGAATNGTVLLGSDGSFQFTPTAGFVGNATFAYHATDGLLSGPSQTVTIQVTGPNAAPTISVPATSPTSTGHAPIVFRQVDGAFVVADPDAGADPIQVAISATHGLLSLSRTTGLTFSQGDGTADAALTFTGTLANINAALDGLTFAPVATYHGTATISATVNDLGNNGSGGPKTGTATLNVNVANEAPVAVADAATVAEDLAIIINVLANDTDAEGDTILPAGVSAPAHGSVVVNAGGTITYTPAPGYNGPDGFTYQASDGSALSATSVTVSITVTGVNDAPTFSDPGTAITINEGQTVTFTVAATDPDGPTSAIRYRLGPGAPAGATVDSVTGAFSWTPADGPSTASVTIIATDAGTPPLEAPTTRTITVGNVAPVVSAIAGDSLSPGGSFARSGSFVDPGADTWIATVDYGDGTGIQPLALSGKSFNLSHLYATPGTFAGVVSVTDKDGGVGTSRFATTVAAPPPPLVVVAGSRVTIKKNAVTAITVTLSDAVSNATGATYRLALAGRDKRFGTRDDKFIALKPATSNAATRAITLATRKKYVLTNTPVRLSVSGLTDSFGRGVDGDKNGTAGGDYSAIFSKRALSALSIRGVIRKG